MFLDTVIWQCTLQQFLITKSTLEEEEIQLSLTNCKTHLCKCNGVADLLKHAPPHTCYHAKFGRSALKGECINIHRTPKY